MKRVILDSLGSKEPTQNVNKFEQREKITPAHKEIDKILGTETDEKCEEVKTKESAELIKHGKRINKNINKIQQSYSIELAKQIAVENEAIKKNSIIPPRSCEKINVQFTKREFLHPARESKKSEEEEWLRHKAKAQQRKQKVKDDIQMDHSEIIKKCSHFFKVEDFASAEEVLNCGIELFPKSAQLYSNRTAVRLKKKDYFGSLEDSEKALDLMLPEVDANKASRAAIRCRRAMALQCLERNVDALIELEIAGKLLPEKEEILTDIDALRNHINRERNDDSEQEDDAETEQTVNECMELKMKESIAKEEGIRNETQISVSREEKFSEEKKVTNWEELD